MDVSFRRPIGSLRGASRGATLTRGPMSREGMTARQ